MVTRKLLLNAAAYRNLPGAGFIAQLTDQLKAADDAMTAAFADAKANGDRATEQLQLAASEKDKYERLNAELNASLSKIPESTRRKARESLEDAGAAADRTRPVKDPKLEGVSYGDDPFSIIQGGRPPDPAAPAPAPAADTEEKPKKRGRRASK